MIVFIFDPMYSKTENQKFAQYSVKNRDRDSDFETETIENSSYFRVQKKLPKIKFELFQNREKSILRGKKFALEHFFS